MTSTARSHRVSAGNWGFGIILTAATASGGGCSEPSCEETLTCPRASDGAAGAAAAGNSTGGAGSGALSNGVAGNATGGGGAAGSSMTGGRGGSTTDASGGDAGSGNHRGGTDGTAGRSLAPENAGAAGADSQVCDGVTCEHGGTCEPSGATFKCDCEPGFDGKYCEHNVNECLEAPCLHGGSCKDGVNEYVCDCEGTGYFGDNCEIAHFELIGPPGATARAISADGNVAVGSIDSVPARWTGETGFQELQASSEPVDYGEALALSADGSVAGGEASFPSGGGAFRWSADTGVVHLDLPSNSVVVGVSADGNSLAVGRKIGGATIAFRWTKTGGSEEIGDIGMYGVVSGMSADGTLIVGSKYDTDDGGFVSFRWTARDGLVWLNFHGVAAAVSGDGNTIVGADHEADGVFTYTSDNGYVHIDTDGMYGATAVNYDGSVIVGSDSGVGWVWDRSHGLRPLSDLLMARGADIGNRAIYMNSVSADGKVLVGTATDKDSNQSHSWIARL